jgi:hypothetical protein
LFPSSHRDYGWTSSSSETGLPLVLFLVERVSSPGLYLVHGYIQHASAHGGEHAVCLVQRVRSLTKPYLKRFLLESYLYALTTTPRMVCFVHEPRADDGSPFVNKIPCNPVERSKTTDRVHVTSLESTLPTRLQLLDHKDSCSKRSL